MSNDTLSSSRRCVSSNCSGLKPQHRKPKPRCCCIDGKVSEILKINKWKIKGKTWRSSRTSILVTSCCLQVLLRSRCVRVSQVETRCDVVHAVVFALEKKNLKREKTFHFNLTVFRGRHIRTASTMTFRYRISDLQKERKKKKKNPYVVIITSRRRSPRNYDISDRTWRRQR